MKISSRSILSPGRVGSSHEPPPITTLSTSLSRRRLSNSRSIRSGTSPAMFPVTGKKRGCGFDNPEPSSPKVTCIGQVRVKAKKTKHPKNVRSLSKRRGDGGIHVRKLERARSQSQHLKRLQVEGQKNNNNNQKWVHIPLTICEALREVSCLFPCRSSCSQTTSFEHEEKMDVGNLRRHVFENLEMNDIILGSKDEARVNACVPPKNALLLMRCRSDPVMMEALTNRFLEPSLDINEEEDEEKIGDCEDNIEESKSYQEFVKMGDEQIMVFGDCSQKFESCEDIEESKSFQEVDKLEDEKVMCFDDCSQKFETCEDKIEESKSFREFDKLENEQIMGFDDCLQKFETCEDIEEINMKMEMEMKHSIQENDDQEHGMGTNEEEDDESFCIGCLFEENGVEYIGCEEEDADSDMEDVQENIFNDDVQENETRELNVEKVEEANEVENGEKKGIKSLPQCLLLMMYEPKLSMEVSKETWVCSSDFIRSHSGRKKRPPPQVESIDGQDELKVIASNNEHDNLVMTTVVSQQPDRSSCSISLPHSMIAVLEENLGNRMGMESLVLSRCKSEPMRTMPKTCCWANNLEPPRRASFGVGMAGLGFC